MMYVSMFRHKKQLDDLWHTNISVVQNVSEAKELEKLIWS